MPRKTIDEKLWDRCELDLVTGCLNWTGPVNSTGYGGVMHNGKVRGAHVLAWEASNGSIPTGKFVCHHCDNPRCCNTDHHYIGDLVTNAKDMYARDRHPRHNAWTNATPQEIAARKAKISAKSKGRPKSSNMRTKLSATVKGRKKLTLPDGSWTWVYPNKQQGAA
jgi:hypothetical protein